MATIARACSAAALAVVDNKRRRIIFTTQDCEYLHSHQHQVKWCLSNHTSCGSPDRCSAYSTRRSSCAQDPPFSKPSCSEGPVRGQSLTRDPLVRNGATNSTRLLWSGQSDSVLVVPWMDSALLDRIYEQSRISDIGIENIPRIPFASPTDWSHIQEHILKDISNPGPPDLYLPEG